MKEEKQLSRNIIKAVQKLKDAFDAICIDDNFYYNHFAEINRENAKYEIITDKSGFFYEIVHSELAQEVEDLIRAILLKKDWLESNPYEYLYPRLEYGKASEEEISFNKQRIAKLKAFYNDLGDECDVGASINFNERI